MRVMQSMLSGSSEGEAFVLFFFWCVFFKENTACIFLTEMHIFQSQGFKSCSSCSSYLITAAQNLSLIYLLVVRFLPLLPLCPSSFSTEIAVGSISCLVCQLLSSE